MSFSFGFSGDDIDIDDSETIADVPDVLVPSGMSSSLPELVKAMGHDMHEWVSLSWGRIHLSLFIPGRKPLII